MRIERSGQSWKCFLGLAIACLATSQAAAQLVVTEYLADTLGSNDDNWEWIEVRNTGGSPIDINGFIGDRLGDQENSSFSIDNTLGGGVNTTIPAGGVAVIYDGDSSLNAVDFDLTKYRSAWGLTPATQLIPATNWPALTNGDGTAFGFWPDATAYSMDVADDGMGVIRVAQFTNAAFSLDYKPAGGFPAIGAGMSNTWSGSGSNQDGANWTASVSGSDGAVTSTAVTIPGSTNNTSDLGSPGKLPGGVAPAGLWVTEIMYNPASVFGSDNEWEWVEVYNKTGAAINFNTNPGVIDDDDDNAKTAENLTTGIIPNNGVAVIFNGSAATLSDMQAAWDPGGVIGTNFIATTGATNTSVVTWTGGLTNGGDRFGIWANLAAYTSEATTAGGNARTMANALTSVAYDDEAATAGLNVTGTWPADNNGASIALSSLTLVSNNAAGPTVGDNWQLSAIGDASGAFNATAIAGTITVHPGGDVGSPGSFTSGGPNFLAADFNHDGSVNGADLQTIKDNYNTGTTNAQGDASGDNLVDGADVLVWQIQQGLPTPPFAAIPEPATIVLLLAGLGGLTRRRRSK